MITLLNFACRQVGQTPAAQQAQSGLFRYVLSQRVRYYSAKPKSEGVKSVVTFSQWLKEHGDQIRNLASLAGLGSAVTGVMYGIAATASARNIKPITDKMESDKNELRKTIEYNQKEINSRFDNINSSFDKMYGLMIAQGEERHKRAQEELDKRTKS